MPRLLGLMGLILVTKRGIQGEKHILWAYISVTIKDSDRSDSDFAQTLERVFELPGALKTGYSSVKRRP